VQIATSLAEKQPRIAAVTVEQPGQITYISTSTLDISSQWLALTAPLFLRVLKASHARASHARAETTLCRNNLRRIHFGFGVFHQIHSKDPFSLEELFLDEILMSSKLIICPSDPQTKKSTDEHYSSYIYIYPAQGDDTPPEAILLMERQQFHPDLPPGTRVVCEVTGMTTFMSEREIKKRLQSQIPTQQKALQEQIKSLTTKIEKTTDEKEKSKLSKHLHHLKAIQQQYQHLLRWAQGKAELPAPKPKQHGADEKNKQNK
jgi:hypothetical protein